jgi:hypothetical protein
MFPFIKSPQDELKKSSWYINIDVKELRKISRLGKERAGSDGKPVSMQCNEVSAFA